MKPSLLMLPSAVSDSRVHNILPNKIDTDFQFSRASAATRVNHQGLIENVGYFSNEKVFSIENSTFPFNTFTDNGGGSYTCISTNTTWAGFRQPGSETFAVTSGQVYRITFDYVLNSGSTFQIFIGDDAVGSSYSGSPITISASGSYSFDVTITTTNSAARLVSQTNQIVNFTISNISVKEIQGDRPRLDYDPINPTCPHLLLEPQSTNLVTFSEDYTQWNKGNNTTVTANYAISPDGTQNATRIQTLASTGSFLSLAASMSSGTAYAFSIYIKNNGGESLNIGIGSASGSGINGAETIVTPTNEWVRYEVLFTADANSNFVVIDNRGNTTALDCLIYGAQLEQQTYATSYIPTAGATGTRVGETCTNAGNVDTFNDAEGVLYTEIASLTSDVSGDNRIVLAKSGDTNNVIRLYYNTTSNTIQYKVRVASSNVCDLTYDLGDSTAFHKICGKWKQNDFALWVDGVEVATDTSGAVFPADTLNTVNFSNANASGDVFYGKVKGLATYNRALTDNELYTITSTQYSAYSGMVAALGNYTIPC